MNVNIPELRKRVNAVEEQGALPRTERWWLQTTWSIQGEKLAFFARDGLVSPSCGTARCFAGDTVLDHLSPGESLYGPDVLDADGNVIEAVSRRARHILGISVDDSARLFHGFNTAVDIRRIAEDIAGERL